MSLHRRVIRLEQTQRAVEFEPPVAIITYVHAKDGREDTSKPRTHARFDPQMRSTRPCTADGAWLEDVDDAAAK